MLTTREMYVLPATDQTPFPVRREIMALILAIAPLVVSFGHVTTVNGRVTAYTDIADILLGVVLICVTLSDRGSSASLGARARLINVAVTVAFLVTAVAHIASGSGLLLR